VVKQLSIQDIALYLGQECQTKDGIGEIISIELAIMNGDRDKVWVSYGPMVIAGEYDPIEVKPVLYPLASITNVDIKELAIVGNWSISDDIIEMLRDAILKDSFGKRMSFKSNAIIIRFLISKGFDLFNWIEDGLAVEKV
jgi:hypothetical protein